MFQFLVTLSLLHAGTLYFQLRALTLVIRHPGVNRKLGGKFISDQVRTVISNLENLLFFDGEEF